MDDANPFRGDPLRAQLTGLDPIIDAHVHVNPWHWIKPGVLETLRRTNPGFDQFAAYSKDARLFLDRMDEEGVERAFLINYISPDVVGYPPETNAWIHEYASADPKRLIPFGGFHPDVTKDPRRAAEELFSKYEVRGVKIHPPHMLVAPNAYLDSAPGLRDLYEECQSRGAPVMFHTGTSVFPGARNKYGDPMLIDDVAVDFPKLKIVLAHAGRPLWTTTAEFLVRRHANVWVDVSSIPPKKLLQNLPNLERYVERVVFGSDWPGPHVPGMRANADAVAGLPLSADSKRKILYENAKRLVP